MSEISFNQILSCNAPMRESRYYQLTQAVLKRLPENWDLYRTYSFELSESLPFKPGVGASAQRLEESETAPDMIRSEQCWVITIYEQTLSTLSDDAVKWVIAHELGHVASGLPCGSLTIGRTHFTRIGGDTYRPITADEKEMHEFVADAIARAWGFWDEEEALRGI
jgi:hypothetical protein